MSITIVSAVGFICAFTGSLAGLAAAIASKSFGRRADGALTGFTAGLLIAFICFKMLDEGFAAAPFYIGAAGLLAGSASAVVMDGFASARAGFSEGTLFLFAIILHHLTEGLALGGMCAVSAKAGLQMAAVISLHIIPEAAAVFVQSKKALARPILTCLLLSLPLAAGCLPGALLTVAGGAFLSLSLTFSAGLMLYFTCGEMLPEARRHTGGRRAVIFAAAGFILGVVITS